MVKVIEYARTAFGCEPSIDDAGAEDDTDPTQTFDPFGDEEVSAEAFERERSTVRGVFSERDDIDELLDSDEHSCLFVPVSLEQLEVLQSLECYREGSMDEDWAVRFKNRYPDAADLYVKVYDTEEQAFWVETESLLVTGDAVTNETIKAFADEFGRSIHLTFDPLAEDHDEPVLRVHIS